MINTLIERRLRSFERSFNYSMDYARDLLAADRKAFFLFSRVMALSAYRRDLPRRPWHVARLLATLREDCGPCTQLCVQMAEADGIDAATLRAVLTQQPNTLIDDARLAYDFTDAVLRRDIHADPLREQVEHRWGAAALASLALAITSARLYPSLKYALGHGRHCVKVVVDGDEQAVSVAA